jgi:hypothetical protein
MQPLAAALKRWLAEHKANDPMRRSTVEPATPFETGQLRHFLLLSSPLLKGRTR